MSNPSPWRVERTGYGKPKRRPIWVVSRTEKRGEMYYESTGHVSAGYKWGATWFRTLELAEAVCEALNSAKGKDRVKEKR